jgi:GTP cyclohydrolase IA
VHLPRVNLLRVKRLPKLPLNKQQIKMSNNLVPPGTSLGGTISWWAMDELTSEFLFAKLGLDSDDPNLIETPERVQRMFSELYVPKEHAQEIIDNILQRIFPTSYSGIVMVSNIVVYSFCPHHLLPVEYEIDIAYIPGIGETQTPVKGHNAVKVSIDEPKALGLSKLVRISDTLSSQLILQETLTDDIANTIYEGLHAKGVAIILKGIHNCMRMRGVKQPKSVALTSTMLGAFRDHAPTRHEFFELLKHSRR